MNSARNKNKVGLIYCTEIFKNSTKQSIETQSYQKKIGSLTGMTPKRNSSVGKIITRPITPKKMLSIQIQTSDIIPLMQAKAVQVQNVIQPKLQKFSQKILKSNHNKVGFLKMTDFNVLSQQANLLTKTIRKKCQYIYRKDDKQNNNIKEDLTINKKIKINEIPIKTQHQTKNNSLSISVNKEDFNRELPKSIKKEDRNKRQQKISKLSALYQKNLARYQTSKIALVDLLKQNKAK